MRSAKPKIGNPQLSFTDITRNDGDVSGITARASRMVLALLSSRKENIMSKIFSSFGKLTTAGANARLIAVVCSAASLMAGCGGVYPLSSQSEEVEEALLVTQKSSVKTLVDEEGNTFQVIVSTESDEFPGLAAEVKKKTFIGEDAASGELYVCTCTTYNDGKTCRADTIKCTRI